LSECCSGEWACEEEGGRRKSRFRNSPADRERPGTAPRLAASRGPTSQPSGRPAVTPAAAAAPAVAASLPFGAPLSLVLLAQHPVEGGQRVVDHPVSSPIRKKFTTLPRQFALEGVTHSKTTKKSVFKCLLFSQNVTRNGAIYNLRTRKFLLHIIFYCVPENI
jgi:hypothetical protein